MKALFEQKHWEVDEESELSYFERYVRTINLCLTASVWRNHFEAMFELQNFRWINFGLRFKFRLKK